MLCFSIFGPISENVYFWGCDIFPHLLHMQSNQFFEQYFKSIRLMFLMKHFFFSLKNTPLLWTVHKPPPHLFRQFPLPNRGFPKHFDIPLFLCFKLSLQKAKGLFSCWRLEEISRGSPEHWKPPSRSRTEPRWGLRGEVPGISGYMGFENLLL